MRVNSLAILLLLLLGFLITGSQSLAQESVPEKQTMYVLKGQVTEEATGDIIPFANVIIKQKGRQLAGVACDFDGLYEIKLDSTQLNGMSVDLVVSYVGFQKKIITGVTLLTGKTRYLNVRLGPEEVCDFYPVIYTICTSFFQEFDSGTKTINKEKIQKNPSRDINEMLTTQPFILGF